MSNELFRLASLIGCEPEDEKRHRKQLLDFVQELVRESARKAIRSYREADELLVREIRIDELNKLIQDGAMQGEWVSVQWLKHRRANLKKSLKADRLRVSEELTGERLTNTKASQDTL